MNAEEVAHLFEDPKRTPRGWDARCPVHDDRVKSLGIAEGNDGGVLLKCLAGCDTGAVLAAKGIEWGDILPDRDRPLEGPAQLVQSYIYQDEAGVPIIRKDRFHPKGFRQLHWNFDAERWEHGLDATPTLPYNLPEVLAAKKERAVFLVEGEKAAEALRGFGIVATTTGGATSWRPAHAIWFKDARKVWVLPDNDEAGRKYAETAAADIGLLGVDIQLLELPGLPPKGDAWDWVQAGGTKERLEQLVHAAGSGIKVWSGAELQAISPDMTEFVVNDLLPIGLTVLAGAPKTGKSLIGIELCHAVATGGLALNHARCMSAASLFFSFEDSLPLVRKRIGEMYGAFPPTMGVVVDKPGSILKNGWKNVERVMSGHQNTRLVVVDTLACVRESGDSRSNAYFEDSKWGHAFHEFALRNRVSLVLVHHDKKGVAPEGADPLDSVSGSKGITGPASAVLVFKRKRFEETGLLQVVGKQMKDRELKVHMTAVQRWVVTPEF